MTFTRTELIALRDRALKETMDPGLSPSWAAAISMLAVAADYLDAMIARTNVIGTQGPPLELGKDYPIFENDGNPIEKRTAPNRCCDESTGCEKEMN